MCPDHCLKFCEYEGLLGFSQIGADSGHLTINDCLPHFVQTYWTCNSHSIAGKVFSNGSYAHFCLQAMMLSFKSRQGFCFFVVILGGFLGGGVVFVCLFVCL